MLETLFWTVSFCLGFNMSMQKHNVLYFLRKPFVNIFYEIENKKNLLKMFPMSNSIKKEIFLLETKYFILKPLILCVTCMPSFWGSAIFILMNGIAFKLIPYLILNSFAAVFINTFINDFYERYIKYGINLKAIPYLILNSFAAVFINTFINDFYERYIK